MVSSGNWIYQTSLTFRLVEELLGLPLIKNLWGNRRRGAFAISHSWLNFLHITNYDSDKQGLLRTDVGPGLQHGLHQLREKTFETAPSGQPCEAGVPADTNESTETSGP